MEKESETREVQAEYEKRSARMQDLMDPYVRIFQTSLVDFTVRAVRPE